MLYFDWNATTPPHPDVLRAMQEAAGTAWANPASVHGAGRRARAHVEDAREAVARLVGMDARDVTLTSGGTEANNLALGATPRSGAQGGSLVVSAIEHPSVVEAARALAASGRPVVWVDPAPSGVVLPETLEAAIDRAAREAPVTLVSLQAVNHETGVIQPVAAASDLAHRAGALLHVDAVQALGRLGPETWQGADLITLAAHKLRGPKGIGALVTRPGVTLRRVLHGGAQEWGRRPGTQDAAASAGLAVAAGRALTTPPLYAALATLRDRIEEELVALGARIEGTPPCRNGDGPRAPHVLNLSWPGWRGPELCAALDLEGVAVSSGSACSSGTAEPSPVIAAMLGSERAASAVRVSLGEETSLDDALGLIRAWERVVAVTARVSSDAP